MRDAAGGGGEGELLADRKTRPRRCTLREEEEEGLHPRGAEAGPGGPVQRYLPSEAQPAGDGQRDLAPVGTPRHRDPRRGQDGWLHSSSQNGLSQNGYRRCFCKPCGYTIMATQVVTRNEWEDVQYYKVYCTYFLHVCTDLSLWEKPHLQRVYFALTC